jgi:hypothetical protein
MSVKQPLAEELLLLSVVQLRPSRGDANGAIDGPMTIGLNGAAVGLNGAAIGLNGEATIRDAAGALTFERDIAPLPAGPFGPVPDVVRVLLPTVIEAYLSTHSDGGWMKILADLRKSSNAISPVMAAAATTSPPKSIPFGDYYVPRYTPNRPLNAIPADAMPAFQSFTFSFTILSVYIKHKRTNTLLFEGTDTDYLSVTAQTNGNPSVPALRPMGDCGEGNHPLNFAVQNLSVTDPNEPVTVQYHVVNSSQSESHVLTALEQAGEKLGTAAIGAVSSGLAGPALGGAIAASIGLAAGSVVPIVGSAIGALVGFLAGYGMGILLPNCDGPVADEIFPMTAAELWDHIRGSTPAGNGTIWSGVTDHSGVSSPSGRGSNSDYVVAWQFGLM